MDQATSITHRFLCPGFDCPAAGCTAQNHGIVMSSDGLYDWLAMDKSVVNPYICVSKCPRGFLWFDLVGKCLMVVEEIDLVKQR